MTRSVGFSPLLVTLVGLVEWPAAAQELVLIERRPDPHGTPRPARNASAVPLRTSLYLELGLPSEAKEDHVLAASVSIRLKPDGGEWRDIVEPGPRFAKAGSGWIRPRQVQEGAEMRTVDLLAVYAELPAPLKPLTTYTVEVQACSRNGLKLGVAGTWQLTTEAAPGIRPMEKYSLDLGVEPVRWHGAFFSGTCNVVFCAPRESFGPTYALMGQARKEHPRAWSYQRDFWLSGTEDRKPWWAVLLDPALPNIVRERETRRIAAMDGAAGGVLLRVEDFFGHEQYGIPTDRALSEDYHPGDEVLIADGLHDARARVLATDDKARTVLVSPVATPEGGWKIAYDGPLPESEDPDAPGLFPPGGCYLRKLKPHGTPCYYWGRLDKEWDLVVGRDKRRVVASFCDAPGDLSLDGRNWNTVKDYAQWHEVARAITGHIIDRYGEASLHFTWSIFNEPDLGVLFWRSDWDELARYYDYTTDAILKAFEDRGHDSGKVFIGGLELAAIFGVHLKLKEFLAHCSPRAEAEGALELNAAFADQRLAGKRSRRVESLCQTHGGKGSPCDFISIHAYNRSELMAAKLIRAKEMALEVDAEYFADLWINSHESCPEWNLPPDEAAADGYLGNGFFPTWCLDVASRQLRQAARDRRYAYGETILTVWPPPQNFHGLNAVTRILHCDDDGDGRADRTVTVPAPIFHVLGLLSDMGDRYWTLPEQRAGGHVVSGFASRDEKGVARVVLYAHHSEDTQSRSDAAYDVPLELSRLGFEGNACVEEYRFDRDHNSYFRQARALRDRQPPSEAESSRVQELMLFLRSDDPEVHLKALRLLERLSPASRIAVFPAVLKLVEQTRTDTVREAAKRWLGSVLSPTANSHEAYSPAEIQEIQKLAECRPTKSVTLSREIDGRLQLTARVGGNGLSFLVIRPETEAKQGR